MTNNTINNATIISKFFEAKAAREAATKQAELNEMVKMFGIDTVIGAVIAHLKAINDAIANVTAEEKQFEEAKRKISTTKYIGAPKIENGRNVFCAVEFSEENRRILDNALAEIGSGLWEKRTGGCKCGKVTNKSFAQFVIDASGNDPQLLKDIITVLRNAKWDSGHGFTRFKMELVYHTIVLHRNRKGEVMDAITEILKNYDVTSLKVTANQNDAYRNHLRYEEKMMMLLEDMVCEKLGEQRKFVGKVNVA